MYICIYLTLALIMTSLTGGLITILGYGVGRLLERLGYTEVVYTYLQWSAVLWLVPIAFLVDLNMDVIRKQWGGIWSQLTPAILMGANIVCMVWLIVALILLIRFVCANVKLSILKTRSFPCDADVMKVYKEVAGELKIPAGRVQVMQSYYAQMPCIFGVWKPFLLLPVDIGKYGTEAVRFIFWHELTHYKQHTPLTRQIVSLIFSLHFFNPMMWWYVYQTRRWSEFACDESVCRDAKQCGEYFKTILKLVLDEDPDSNDSSKLLEDKHELLNRVKRMHKILSMKKRTKWKTAVLVFALVLSGTCSVGATSLGAAKSYVNIFDQTSVMEIEAAESEELEEFIDTESLEGITIIQEEVNEEDEGISLATTVKTLDWTVKAKTMNSTRFFYLKSGGNINIAVQTNPSNVNIYIGIVEPNGVRRCVYSSGFVSHTFKLDQTGFYQVYMRNLTSTDVTVVGAYVYGN